MTGICKLNTRKEEIIRRISLINLNKCWINMFPQDI